VPFAPQASHGQEPRTSTIAARRKKCAGCSAHGAIGPTACMATTRRFYTKRQSTSNEACVRWINSDRDVIAITDDVNGLWAVKITAENDDEAESKLASFW